MPDAITERISQAVAKIIRGLNLDPAPTAVVFRKRPMKLDGDSLPLVVVSVGDEETFEPLCCGNELGKLVWLVKRPVSVALAFASEGKVADNPALRQWRNAIWGAVTAYTLERTGFLPEANDVNPAGRAMFDLAALRSTTVDWSLIDPWIVETLETRDAFGRQ